jgi:hypothetical protein
MKHYQLLEIESFLKAYISFNKINTWTKQKHKFRNEMLSLIPSNKYDKVIYIHCHSKNCIITDSNDFIITKINSKRKGFFIPFRNKWVMIYSIRERYYMCYKVHILPSNFNAELFFKTGNFLGIDISSKLLTEDNYI